MRAALLVVFAACGEPPPADTGWLDGPALPEGRLEPAVVAAGDALWVIGGFDDGIEVTATTWILDDGADAWRAGPDAPAALSHACVAAIDDTIYGLVGTEFTPTAEAWALDPDTATWRALAPMPEARGAAAVIVDGARIVLAGGSDAAASLATVIAYDTATDAWSSLPGLPSPRSHAIGARAPDGSIVVIGGTATLDATQPIADVLALVDATWEARAPMPTARGGCAAATLDDVVICAGGEAATSALRVTEAYDLVVDTWTTLDPLPRGRAGTGGAAMAGRLWVPGGAHALRYEPTDAVSSLLPNP